MQQCNPPCPPHLCEQWFHHGMCALSKPVDDTAARAARLDAAAATGNVEHYTATIEAMIREDQTSEGEEV